MRTSFINSTALASLIVRNADNETGAALPLPSDSPATGKRILEAAQPVPASSAIAAFVAADGAKRAEKQAAQKAAREAATSKPAAKADTSKRKLAGNAAKPANGKPAASEPAKPAIHETRSSYIGASPTFRHHGKKLSPIVLDRIPGSFTERDAAFLSDLFAAYGTKPFKRYDADAGNVSRAIGHGYIKPVSGSLDSRLAEFALTERYIRERQQSAKAKPSKPNKA